MQVMWDKFVAACRSNDTRPASLGLVDLASGYCSRQKKCFYRPAVMCEFPKVKTLSRNMRFRNKSPL